MFRIQRLPEQYVSDAEAALSDLAKGGWELTHIYNHYAFLKAATGGSSTSGSLTTTVDAFGRGRVSEPFTLGDYKHIYGLDDLFISRTNGDGFVTSSVNRASVFLSASNSASYAIHQSKMYHHYMPGKSQTILSSFVFGAAVSGSTKRTGYFDDFNGIFLEQDYTGSLQFVIRSAINGTSSIQETRVKQTAWNVNTLLSGDNVLDITKTQLLYIDFQWLSIGRVRCGFVIKGTPIICHVFDHANEISSAYMQTPNLPIRCELVNAFTTQSRMEQICTTVFSEGGYAEAGKAFSFSNDTYVSLAGNATLPVLAIRLKSSLTGLPNRAFVRLQQAAVFTDQQTVRWILTKLPSGSALTTSSAWISADPSSIVEYNSGSAYSGGKIMLSGFVGANSLNPNQANPISTTQAGVSNKQNFIAQNYGSTDSEIYLLVAKNMTANTTNVAGSMLWSEIY